MDQPGFRESILQEIDELRALSDRSKDSRAPVELDQQSVGRLSRMDAMQQQSMDLAREERRRQRLAVLGAALRCAGWMRMNTDIALHAARISCRKGWRSIRP